MGSDRMSDKKTPVYHTEIVQAVGARSHVERKEEKNSESKSFVLRVLLAKLPNVEIWPITVSQITG